VERERRRGESGRVVGALVRGVPGGVALSSERRD